ncbi:MAG: aldehyde-activating protein [Confluentimicrobium sp.]|uniref:GFA family protein n=1 Tax=Actibacterium sp. TaxID=1872125 RepID=UPI000C5A49E9|nr:GFA family protein [Actibacterium sp.]MBC55640.1 aldehyde-activating protein [Actibacterium sp.]
MTDVTGGCLCGEVRFSVSGSPDRVGICHCLDCRKHHGAVFFAAAVFAVNAFKFTGSPREYKGRSFCSKCGSPVFSRSDNEIEVHLGALDAPDQYEPTYELWACRREAWLPTFPTMTQFTENRMDDDINE